MFYKFIDFLTMCNLKDKYIYFACVFNETNELLIITKEATNDFFYKASDLRNEIKSTYNSGVEP